VLFVNSNNVDYLYVMKFLEAHSVPVDNICYLFLMLCFCHSVKLVYYCQRQRER